MSNKIYDEEFFNEEQKERYLKGLGDQTRVTYGRVLKRASILEVQHNKDLYNFNLYEISQLMKLLAPTTYQSSNAQLATIRKYLDWAISNDLRNDNINPLLATMTEEFINSFIDKTNKYLFTEEEINGIIGRTANFQDSALIRCLFEGIMGRGYSEILNILQKDLDPESNILVVRNKPASGQLEERNAVITDQLMGLLLGAGRQEVYYKGNGRSTHHLNEVKIVDSPYVFRPIDLNTKYTNATESTFVSRRIGNLGKWFGYSYLTPINIRKSGMVKYAFDLYNETGKFEREEIVTVCKRYNMNHNITTRLTKEFLNIETIESLYGKLNCCR
jgi:Site-specific recombinase XerD